MQLSRASNLRGRIYGKGAAIRRTIRLQKYVNFIQIIANIGNDALSIPSTNQIMIECMFVHVATT